jgi:hypothetical protein
LFPIAFLEDIKIMDEKKKEPFVAISLQLNTEGKSSPNISLDKCEGAFEDKGFASQINFWYAAFNLDGGLLASDSVFKLPGTRRHFDCLMFSPIWPAA